jgi:nucleoside-diphosphate-sugar epimerase
VGGEPRRAESLAAPADRFRGLTVRERLAGKKILLTGATGFVGKAILATLLRTGAELRQIVLPIRAESGHAARGRLEELLAAAPFEGLPSERLAELVAADRIEALPCDLENEVIGVAAEEAWGGVDVAIHCAATVSFEEPLDDALGLNAYGPRRLLEHLREGGSDPHFVHVSTAYVAPRRSGVVPEEETLPEALDPDVLLAEGQAVHEDVEERSRLDPLRRRFDKAAGRDAARRANLDQEGRAEELRARWVRETLAREGRRRAQALGWPDTYALSKALGERLVAEISTHTTVIRPTIVESALKTPRPGWLEGIKVADPLILAYASRGLTHLPGRAENVIDLVPVDLVANACVAAAAHPSEERLRAIAVGSSARRPLPIGRLAAEIRRYFLSDPLPGRDGSPIPIGTLRFVERREALRRTIRRERLAAAAARVAIASPVRLPQERLLRSNRALAERVTRMVKIYGAYTELDCVFDDANARRLAAELDPTDRVELSFDTAEIDWEDYLQRVHLPEVRRLAG